MALKNYEVLAVVSNTLALISQKLEDDGEISKADVVDIVQSTVMDLLKEYSDDD